MCMMQGQLGDCYFISALCVLADKKPSEIKKLFGYTEESFLAGMSSVSVNNDGMWQCVMLDHYFPCNEDRHLVFSKSREGEHVLWVSLIEKAYAKLHSSYLSIERGTTSESLQALTGAPCVHFDLHDKSNVYHYCNKETLWKELMYAKENDFLICTSTHANTNNKTDDENFKKRYGLVRGHAYAFSEWTDELLDELNHRDDDDGSFFMLFDDFDNHFETVTICRCRDNYCHSTIPLTFASEQDMFGITFIPNKLYASNNNDTTNKKNDNKIESSFSIIQPKKRGNRDNSAYEYDHYYFELYMYDKENEVWQYIASSEHRKNIYV
eukprot:g9526.t1